jgi:hypothetical protein
VSTVCFPCCIVVVVVVVAVAVVAVVVVAVDLFFSLLPKEWRDELGAIEADADEAVLDAEASDTVSVETIPRIQNSFTLNRNNNSSSNGARTSNPSRPVPFSQSALPNKQHTTIIDLQNPGQPSKMASATNANRVTLPALKSVAMPPNHAVITISPEKSTPYTLPPLKPQIVKPPPFSLNRNPQQQQASVPPSIPFADIEDLDELLLEEEELTIVTPQQPRQLLAAPSFAKPCPTVASPFIAKPDLKRNLPASYTASIPIPQQQPTPSFLSARTINPPPLNSTNTLSLESNRSLNLFRSRDDEMDADDQGNDSEIFEVSVAAVKKEGVKLEKEDVLVNRKRTLHDEQLEVPSKRYLDSAAKKSTPFLTSTMNTKQSLLSFGQVQFDEPSELRSELPALKRMKHEIVMDTDESSSSFYSQYDRSLDMTTSGSTSAANLAVAMTPSAMAKKPPSLLPFPSGTRESPIKCLSFLNRNRANAAALTPMRVLPANVGKEEVVAIEEDDGMEALMRQEFCLDDDGNFDLFATPPDSQSSQEKRSLLAPTRPFRYLSEPVQPGVDTIVIRVSISYLLIYFFALFVFYESCLKCRELRMVW